MASGSGASMRRASGPISCPRTPRGAASRVANIRSRARAGSATRRRSARSVTARSSGSPTWGHSPSRHSVASRRPCRRRARAAATRNANGRSGAAHVRSRAATSGVSSGARVPRRSACIDGVAPSSASRRMPGAASGKRATSWRAWAIDDPSRASTPRRKMPSSPSASKAAHHAATVVRTCSQPASSEGRPRRKSRWAILSSVSSASSRTRRIRHSVRSPYSSGSRRSSLLVKPSSLSASRNAGTPA